MDRLHPRIARGAARELQLCALLLAESPRSPQQLSKAMGVLPSLVTRTLKNLEDDYTVPLILRVVESGDRRKFAIRLTAAGQEWYQKVQEQRAQELMGRVRAELPQVQELLLKAAEEVLWQVENVTEQHHERPA